MTLESSSTASCHFPNTSLHSVETATAANANCVPFCCRCEQKLSECLSKRSSRVDLTATRFYSVLLTYCYTSTDVSCERHCPPHLGCMTASRGPSFTSSIGYHSGNVSSSRFMVQSSQAPAYLVDDCCLESVTELRQQPSADIGTCVVPRSRSRFGDRSFYAAGARV